MPFLNAALHVRNVPAPPAFKPRRKSPEEPPRRVAFSHHPGQQQEQGREHNAEPIGESVSLFCNRPGLRARLQANCLSQAGDGQRKAIKDSPTPLKNKCEHAKTQYQKNRKNGPTQTVPPDLRLPRKNAYMKKALWAQTRDRNVSTTVARTRLFKRFLPHGASPARALRRQFESARTSYSTSLLAASLDPKQHPTPDATDRTRTPNSPHNLWSHRCLQHGIGPPVFLTAGPRKGLALGLGTQGPDP